MKAKEIIPGEGWLILEVMKSRDIGKINKHKILGEFQYGRVYKASPLDDNNIEIGDVVIFEPFIDTYGWTGKYVIPVKEVAVIIKMKELSEEKERQKDAFDKAGDANEVNELIKQVEDMIVNVRNKTIEYKGEFKYLSDLLLILQDLSENMSEYAFQLPINLEDIIDIYNRRKKKE